MRYKIASINEYGKKFVSINELPLPDKPVNITVSQEYIKYNSPYGVAISRYSLWFICVNGYTFSIKEYPNHFVVESGVIFFAYCESWNKALQL